MNKYSLICLHGWNLCGSVFSPLEKALRKYGYKTYAPDLPGFDKLKKLDKPLKLSDYVDFISSYIAERKIQNPIIIGHSFGGRIGLKYAVLYPKSIRALILSGTPIFSSMPKIKLIIYITIAKIGGAIISLPPFSQYKCTIQRWYYNFIGARDLSKAEGQMQITFKQIVQEDLGSYIKLLKVPCQLIWGEWDKIVPVEVAQKIKNLLHRAELIVISSADHAVLYRQPEVSASIIHRFILSL